eukprot:15214691-Heterocapsa_arctica.AAC.1
MAISATACVIPTVAVLGGHRLREVTEFRRSGAALKAVSFTSRDRIQEVLRPPGLEVTAAARGSPEA